MLNKAQEMFQRTKEGRILLLAGAEDFYNETLIDIGDKADEGLYEYSFPETDVSELLRPHIDTLIVPLFEKNGFHVRTTRHSALFGGDFLYYHINWYQTGEENE